MSEDSKSAAGGEQDTFKEQMAARYRERMSMGYIVPENSAGGGPTSSLEDQNDTADTQPSDMFISGCDSAHKERELSPIPADTPSDTDMYRKRPVMKELITKFEAREALLKENEPNAFAKLDLDQNAPTSSSFSEEMNPTAVQAGEGPPQALQSHAQISLNAEASYGTADATDTNAVAAEPYQTGTRSKETSQSNSNRQATGKPKSPLNINPRRIIDQNQRTSPFNTQKREFYPNSSAASPSQSGFTATAGTDTEVYNAFRKQKQEGNEGPFVSKNSSIKSFDTGHDVSIVTGHPPICPHSDSGQKLENRVSEILEPEAPQRVNLREIAMKSKQGNGPKKDMYVVHKKEWGKRFWDLRQHPSTNQLSPRATSTPKPEELNNSFSRTDRGRFPTGFKSEHRRAHSALPTSKACSSQRNLNESSLESLKISPRQSPTADTVQMNSISATPLNTQQRIIKRNITRLVDAKKSNEKEKEEKRMTAMERYLEFLKTSTPPLIPPDSYDGAQGLPFLSQSYNGPSLADLGKKKKSPLNILREPSPTITLNGVLHEMSKQTATAGEPGHDKITTSPRLTLNPPKVIPSPFNLVDAEMVDRTAKPRRISSGGQKSPKTQRSCLGQLSFENRSPHNGAMNGNQSPIKLRTSPSRNLNLSFLHGQECQQPPRLSPHRQNSEHSPNKIVYRRQRSNSPQSPRALKENVHRPQHDAEQGDEHQVLNPCPGDGDSPIDAKVTRDISPIHREISDLANRLLTKEELSNNDLMPKYFGEMKQAAASDGLSLYSSEDESYPLSIDEKLKRIKTKRLMKMIHDAELAKQEMSQYSEVHPGLTVTDDSIFIPRKRKSSPNNLEESQAVSFSSKFRSEAVLPNQRPCSELNSISTMNNVENPALSHGTSKTKTSPKTNSRQAKVPVPASRKTKIHGTPSATTVTSRQGHKDKGDSKVGGGRGKTSKDGRRRAEQHGVQAYDSQIEMAYYSPNNSLTGWSTGQVGGKSSQSQLGADASAHGDNPLQGRDLSVNDGAEVARELQRFADGQGKDALDETHKEVAYHFGMTTQIEESVKCDTVTPISDGTVKKKKKVKGEKTKKIKKKKKKIKEDDGASSFKSDSRNASFNTSLRTSLADGTKKKKHISAMAAVPEHAVTTRRQTESRMGTDSTMGTDSRKGTVSRMGVRRPYSEERRPDQKRREDISEIKAPHSPDHGGKRHSWSSDKTLLATDLTPPKSSKMASPGKWSANDTSGSVQWRSPKEHSRSLSARRHIVQRLISEPTERWPLHSNIPVMDMEASPPRKQLEVLTLYRRWREDFMDCFRPCRLPLSDSFKKSLDSAVMQEWSMHCWDSMSRYMNSRGSWHVGADDKEANFPDGAAGPPEKKRIQDLRLGPVKLSHVMYLIMGAVSVGIGHQAVTLYNCDGDDLDYYCSADDEESCLSQLAPALMGEVAPHIV